MQAFIVRSFALLCLTVMCSRNSFAQDDNSREHYLNIDEDSSHVPPVSTVNYRHGAMYTLQMAGDSILRFSINGKNIPREDWYKYRDGIAETVRYVREARIQLAQDRRQLACDRGQLDLDRRQMERSREQAERDKAAAEQYQERAQEDMKQQLREQTQQLRNQEQALRDQQQAMENRMVAEKDRERADRNRMDAERNMVQAQQNRMASQRDREQAQRDRLRAERQRIIAEEDRRLFLDSISRDLVKDGIVPDRDSIHSFELDADHVSVNGKRLPAALEKKYIDKYTRDGFSMSYHNDDEE